MRVEKEERRGERRKNEKEERRGNAIREKLNPVISLLRDYFIQISY